MDSQIVLEWLYWLWNWGKNLARPCLLSWQNMRLQSESQHECLFKYLGWFLFSVTCHRSDCRSLSCPFRIWLRENWTLYSGLSIILRYYLTKKDFKLINFRDSVSTLYRTLMETNWNVFPIISSVTNNGWEFLRTFRLKSCPVLAPPAP